MSAHAVAPILLASTSPQRRVILEQLGIPFDAVAPDYEEHDPPDADPVELVREHVRQQVAMFDLSFDFFETRGGVRGELEYATDRWDRDSAETLVARLARVLAAMAAASRTRELILPLLFLPLAIPLVVGGVGASVSTEPGRYLTFLGLYDAVFALLCWASFEYVVSE